jgi:septal ring factor EnvC (AmiA/AmiB activator)
MRLGRGPGWTPPLVTLAGLVGCAALLVVAPAAAGPGKDAERAAERKAQREKLSELAKQLEDKRAALRDLDNQSRSILLTLSELDEALAQLLEEQERAHKRVEKLRQRVVDLSQAIEADEAQSKTLTARLNKRLRVLYVMGEGGAVRHVLGADSFEDLALRQKLITNLADSDARLVRERLRVQEGLADKRRQLALSVEDAELIELELKKQADLLKGTRRERQQIIARLDEEKELGVRQVREIVAQRKEVTGLIAKLDAEANNAGRRRRGRLGQMSWPVRGQLLRGYGVTREGSVRLVSNGYHVKAKLGAVVAAPANGRVMFTGTLRGFGRLVILEHEGGIHTLLAHLSRIVVEKDDEVVTGQTVGFVGDTGSTEGPKLYIEVRKGGRPQNPSRYLR